MSLVAQRFDRIEPRGAPRRIDRRKKGKTENMLTTMMTSWASTIAGKPRKKIKFRRKEIRMQQPVQELADRFDILSDEKTEKESCQRPADADRGACDEKIRMIAPRVAPMVRRIAIS